MYTYIHTHTQRERGRGRERDLETVKPWMKYGTGMLTDKASM